jgi:glycosyltransferase involved in cell wall biosynthesis
MRVKLRDGRMTGRSLLLVADGFYPREVPPECKINTHLALALGRRGWNVSVWTGHDAQVPLDSINVRIVGSTSFWSLAEVFRIFKWLLLNRPTRMILMYHNGLYSGRSNIDWVPMIARLVGVHCVTLFINSVQPPRSIIQVLLSSLLGYGPIRKYRVGLLGASSKMVFYCDADRNALLGIDPLNLKVRSQITTPPSTMPVDGLTSAQRERAPLGLTDKDFLVGYFGLLYPGKGVEWLIEAMQALRNKGMDAKLILVGPNGSVTAHNRWNSECLGYEALLKRNAVDLADSIIWSGFCEDLQAVQILKSCDVVCLPFEAGLTNSRTSFITCAQIGVPVITTLTSATDEILRDPGSGITYVEPKNSAQIADRITLFYKDRELMRKRGLMLRGFAIKHYNDKHFVDCFDSA